LRGRETGRRLFILGLVAPVGSNSGSFEHCAGTLIIRSSRERYKIHFSQWTMLKILLVYLKILHKYGALLSGYHFLSVMDNAYGFM
jgi:hypothetical protein